MPTDVSCGIADVTESAGYFAYDSNSHTCSQEQIFSPIRIRKTGQVSMGFEIAEMSPDMTLGTFGNFHVGATRSELDPYFSQFGGDDGKIWMEETDFQIVANNLGTETNIRKTNRGNITRVHTSGLRGPLMIGGFGTDLADKPVPCMPGKPFQFDASAIGDRTLWKTGPVNLMWDYERKVWSGGPQILCGVAKENITAPQNPCEPTQFDVAVFRSGTETGYDDLSNKHICETITVYNHDVSLSQADVPGYVWVVAVRINYRWVALWVGCPETEDVPTDDDKNVISPDCYDSDCQLGGEEEEDPDEDNPGDPPDGPGDGTATPPQGAGGPETPLSDPDMDFESP